MDQHPPRLRARICIMKPGGETVPTKRTPQASTNPPRVADTNWHLAAPSIGMLLKIDDAYVGVTEVDVQIPTPSNKQKLHSHFQKKNAFEHPWLVTSRSWPKPKSKEASSGVIYCTRSLSIFKFLVQYGTFRVIIITSLRYLVDGGGGFSRVDAGRVGFIVECQVRLAIVRRYCNDSRWLWSSWCRLTR
ncbi:hypothetical protein BDY19DRAFT_1047645 [Irpex rosettiformis]|uniref:Uncharacterized protein n=1 Tax=Irpex rosettiformis TaxID=378272 RepID=A0ACB8U6D2_9APHY|nr:hypothetical protein BDY19DRAFT_1047645 [Irpex rosettiformis]